MGIVLQKDATQDDPAVEDLCAVGTLGRVVHHLNPQPSLHHAVCQGTQRFRVIEAVDRLSVHGGADRAHRRARRTSRAEAQALALQLRERALELLLAAAQRAGRAGACAADDARHGRARRHHGQRARRRDGREAGAAGDGVHRGAACGKLLQLLSHRIEVLRLSSEIGERTKEQLDDRQRKFLLREQLKTIQKELGENGGDDAEMARLDEAIAKAGMPADTEAHARKELQRLRGMPDGSGEYSDAAHLARVDGRAAVGARPTETPIDLAAARATLEADHFGLERVKQRIVEFLAVRKLNPQGRAPILCFVGPPGVGKTSLGQSIARALQRPFVRVSLGGVHDEAEIRGHRRTYIGAMPGNIVQGLRKAGARDCVMMLDEVDKLTASAHGDPSAALLEVLDPEQNSTFRDNYLGVPFDLSRVVFIATANVIDNVPRAGARPHGGDRPARLHAGGESCRSRRPTWCAGSARPTACARTSAS